MRSTLLLSSFLFSIVFAQNEQQNLKIKIVDPDSLFSSVQRKIDPEERGKFETLSEYNKRIFVPIDTNSIFYLEVDFTLNTNDDPFDYDIDTQKLTFKGGKSAHLDIQQAIIQNEEIKLSKVIKYEGAFGTAVLINTDYEDRGEYTASNALGNKISVSKYDLSNYVLNFVNFPKLPDSVFNDSLGEFSLSIYKKPTVAEQLTKQVILVVGVKPASPYFACLNVEMIHEPSFQSPKDWTSFSKVVDVQFVTLMLYNKKTKNVVFELKY